MKSVIIFAILSLTGVAHSDQTTVYPVGNGPGNVENLKVLTFNAWLLKFLGVPIGKDIPARLEIMPKEIAQTGADVISFQEVWSNRNRRYLSGALKELGYSYSYFLPRQFKMGNGLLVVSKYPIVDHKIANIFSDVTRPDEIFASKRGLYTEIELPSGKRIDLFNVHFGAITYDKKSGSYHEKQKRRQARQFQEFKNWFKSTRKNPIAFIAGDLNSDFRVLEGGRFIPVLNKDYSEFITQACEQNEDALNTFLSFHNLDHRSEGEPTFSRDNPYVVGGHFSDAPSETEDYIFSCGIRPEQITNSQVLFKSEPLNRPHDLERPVRLSDHYGVMSSFSI